MQPSDEEIRRLHQSLARIDDAMADLARGPELSDPDSLEQCLTAEVAMLRGCLAQLMADPSHATSPFDWRSKACALARRAAALWPEPLRCEVVEAGALLHVDADPELADALVSRLLSIALAHAGAGGTLRVEPRAENGCAALELTAHPLPGAPSPRPAPERCRTLTDLLARAGGSVRFVDAGVGSWAALLRLPRAKTR